MNIYEAMKLSLEVAKCESCGGRGQINDAEPGDTRYETWQCPDCDGAGIKKSSLGTPQGLSATSQSA